VSVVLNEEQYRALGEITRAVSAGNRHLLTGYAGSGKTTLMQYVAREMLSQKKSVILSAPTHKALAALGWDQLVIWECELKDREALKGRLTHFLGGQNAVD
jgi:ABC-type transport system involved in cytochrome bd biosynthesis fused ATPase/permease subunit